MTPCSVPGCPNEGVKPVGIPELKLFYCPDHARKVSIGLGEHYTAEELREKRRAYYQEHSENKQRIIQENIKERDRLSAEAKAKIGRSRKKLCSFIKSKKDFFASKEGMKAFVQGGEAAEKRLKELMRKAGGKLLMPYHYVAFPPMGGGPQSPRQGYPSNRPCPVCGCMMYWMSENGETFYECQHHGRVYAR